MPDQIFISYAHEDGAWLEEFRKMLAPAESKGLVQVWSDQKILPGTPWQKEIGQALEQTRVALLLVTPAFLDSAFIRDEELRTILAAANDGAVLLYWVPVSASLVEYAGLGAMQAACDPNSPLESMDGPTRRAKVAEVCRKILDQLGQLPKMTRGDRVGLRAQVSARLGDQYELAEEIGTGSSAIIFKAQDRAVKRTVAVKTLVTSALQPQSAREFQEQVEIAYRFKSPAYMRIYDHFLDLAPHCVVSEYVDGCCLTRYLELSNRVAPRNIKVILLDLATALAEAHENGYLHDGLTPSNVYIDGAQRPKISAFRFLNLAPNVGMWGTFLINHETCTFLSPEQFDGHPRSQLSDQYALGLIGRELLTGKSIEPIDCPADFVRRPDVFRALATEDAGSDRNGALAGIVSRMLRVDPGDRWNSMAELALLLDDLVVFDTDLDRLRREVVTSYTQLQNGDHEQRFYRAFYQQLFELVPDVAQHFPADRMPRQYLALNRAIKMLLDYNPARPDTVSAIRNIARQHAKFRLNTEHLAAFSRAIGLALRDMGEGEARVLEAWQSVLSPGLEEMRRVLIAESEAPPASNAASRRRSGIEALCAPGSAVPVRATSQG